MRATTTCLISHDRNRYSVDARAAGRSVLVRVFAERIVVLLEGEVVADPLTDDIGVLVLLSLKAAFIIPLAAAIRLLLEFAGAACGNRLLGRGDLLRGDPRRHVPVGEAIALQANRKVAQIGAARVDRPTPHHTQPVQGVLLGALKLVKRMMYGRAKLDLLRARLVAK